jgi:hypothetical protein
MGPGELPFLLEHGNSRAAQSSSTSLISTTDCTPKAVTHRITNLKKIAATLDTNGVTPAPAPITTPTTPKTPKKRTKTGEDGEDGTPTPNKKARTPNKGKGKKGATEETNGHAEGGEGDAENGEEKVKTEDGGDATDEVA